MDLSIGIFLASIFLGIIILFIVTKDRWKWKVILRWSIIIIVGIGIAAGAAVWSTSRPKIQESFWGLSLRMNKSDVKFIKGEPYKTDKDDTVWYYNEPYTSDVIVVFKEDRVKGILNLGRYDLTIQNVGIGTTSQTILKKFGQPSETINSEDELTRTYQYYKYNLFFMLKENKVVQLGLADYY